MSSELLTEHRQNLAEIREKALNMIRILSKSEDPDELLKNKANINGFIKICCMLIKLIPVENEVNLNLSLALEESEEIEDVSQEDIKIITSFLEEVSTKKEVKNG